MRVIRLDSYNGELHYAIEEFDGSEPLESGQTIKASKIKEITKKDASKLLYLMREE